MKKNKKGFTLVELLAVIVILAVILIIAIPQIANTIEGIRIRSMGASVVLIATNAEKDYFAQKAATESYNATSTPCTDVAKLSKDYSSCTITYNTNGEAFVTLMGASGSKFSNMQCVGTKDDVSCTKLEWVYAFGNITNASDGEEDFTNLKDEFNNSRPVFIRFNKNDLSEKYVCTTYNMTNNEPTCISANAYNTRNDADAEWNTIKALFGESNCSGPSYGASYMHCRVVGSPTWYCQSSNTQTYCGHNQNDLVTSCRLDSSVSCHTYLDDGGK